MTSFHLLHSVLNRRDEYMKTAVLDAGGGLRGIYGAGVLDYCVDHGIRFDFGIGVSAGAANLSSYIASQSGRNYNYYVEYSQRPEYMSLRNFRTRGSYIDMDYIYGTLSNAGGEYPLDYDALMKTDQQLYVVATNALTGRPVYFSKEDMGQDHYEIISASCSIPVVNKPYYVKGIPFYDGALTDPIPVNKALELGADRIVLILTKPESEIRNARKDTWLAGHMRHYRKAAGELKTRSDKYNRGVAQVQQLVREGRALIIAPDDTCGVSTLSRDPEDIKALYAKGYKDAEKILEFMQQEA